MVSTYTHSRTLKTGRKNQKRVIFSRMQVIQVKIGELIEKLDCRAVLRLRLTQYARCKSTDRVRVRSKAWLNRCGLVCDYW